ncbi:outer membrane beta-barrel protein [Alloacidobacterium dinghuense]|uniref:Outer membrane beta-barrel protein n=1 Tax=Alloacidobacterium dinghuense TaxID=2763107 RepID=A0A7G8BGG0_9BACT|nr:outer membrane beta-barrel protein [Alloacidobacterium dinghuense]QNI31630.1 outer membrane beta-barrel protein [Alloacidobacterium dinghuense]
MMRRLLSQLPVALCFFAFGGLFVTGSARAQTDAAASLYGSFSGTTAANGTVQSPSNAAGVLLELRHISNPLVGYELNYSFNRANQNYNDFEEIKTAAHEVGADWFVSFPVLMLKPFILAGGGIIFFHPDSGQPDSKSDAKPVFVYGAGVDWTVIPHIGLRFQYRGNLYHAPDVSHAFSSTNAFTHTAEPMIGAYLRF